MGRVGILSSGESILACGLYWKSCLCFAGSKKLPDALRHVYALLVVSASWPLFAFTKAAQGLGWLRAMFSGTAADSGSMYLLVSYAPLLVLCALAATPLGSRCYRRLGQKRKQQAVAFVDCGGILCLLLLCMAYLVSGSYNPFLYFRF